MSPVLELGLFGHSRDLVEIHEVAIACRIPIGDNPRPKREHLRVKRFSVEAWLMEKLAARNGVELPFKASAEVKAWREHLRSRDGKAKTRGRR